MLAAAFAFLLSPPAGVADLKRAVASLIAEAKEGRLGTEDWSAVASAMEPLVPPGRRDLHLSETAHSLFPGVNPDLWFSTETRTLVRGRRHAELWVAFCGDSKSLWLVDSGGSKTHIAVLKWDMESQYGLYPEEADAFATDNRLVVTGVLGFGNNAPSNGLQVYENDKPFGWGLVQEVESAGETAERPRIRYRDGQPSLGEFVSTSRLYPSTMSVCHACPHLLIREWWTLDSNRYIVRQQWEQTPLLTLENILLALKKGENQELAAWLADSSLLPHVKHFWKGLDTDDLGLVDVPRGQGDRATVYVLRDPSGPSDALCRFIRSGRRWKLSSLTLGRWDDTHNRFVKSTAG